MTTETRPITEQQLASLKAVDAARPQGPWVYDRANLVFRHPMEGYEAVMIMEEVFGHPSSQTIAFVEHCSELVPGLIAAIEQRDQIIHDLMIDKNLAGQDALPPETARAEVERLRRGMILLRSRFSQLLDKYQSWSALRAIKHDLDLLLGSVT